ARAVRADLHAVDRDGRQVRLALVHDADVDLVVARGSADHQRGLARVHRVRLHRDDPDADRLRRGPDAAVLAAQRAGNGVAAVGATLLTTRLLDSTLIPPSPSLTVMVTTYVPLSSGVNVKLAPEPLA